MGNDKTYLDAMTGAEAAYIRDVATVWHQWRIGEITESSRDAQIATRKTAYEAQSQTLRNKFRVDQAADAKTFRNAVANASKTHVDSVTTEAETLTTSLQQQQADLAEAKWNAWLAAAKALVNLDTESAIERADSLEEKIGELAGENPVASYSPNGNSELTETVSDHPFWTKLHEKAEQSADYIRETKEAERLYYGRGPFAITGPNGIIGDHPGTRGVLDARRDFEVGVADVTATRNIALQHAAGVRDRELASASRDVALARSEYEVGWANLLVEDAQWKLPASSLAFNSEDANASSITVDANGGGTSFVPGWLSATDSSPSQSYSYSDSPSQNNPHASALRLKNAPSTSTGFNATDLDQYFSAGLLPDMPGSEPVWSGTAGRDDAAFRAALTESKPTGNLTQPPGDGEDATETALEIGLSLGVLYSPPEAFVRFALLGMGRRMPEVAGVAADGPSFGLPAKPASPSSANASLRPYEAAYISWLDDHSGERNAQQARVNRPAEDCRSWRPPAEELPDFSKLVDDMQATVAAAEAGKARLAELNAPLQHEIDKLRVILAAIDEEFRRVLKSERGLESFFEFYMSIDGPGRAFESLEGQLNENNPDGLQAVYGGVFSRLGLTPGYQLGAVTRFHNYVQIRRRISALQAQMLTRASLSSDGTTIPAEAGVYHVIMVDGSVKTINFTEIDPAVAALYREQLGMVPDVLAIARSQDLLDFAAYYADTLALILLSVVPGVGEGLDAYTAADSDAEWWQRGLAGFSLVLGAWTAGLTPNFGAILRIRSADEVIDAARSAVRHTSRTSSFQIVTFGDPTVLGSYRVELWGFDKYPGRVGDLLFRLGIKRRIPLIDEIRIADHVAANADELATILRHEEFHKWFATVFGDVAVIPSTRWYLLRGPTAYFEEILAYGIEAGGRFRFRPIAAWGSLSAREKWELVIWVSGGSGYSIWRIIDLGWWYFGRIPQEESRR